MNVQIAPRPSQTPALVARATGFVDAIVTYLYKVVARTWSLVNPGGPFFARPDLDVSVFRLGNDLAPRERFGVGILVRNVGTGAAVPTRVQVGFPLDFTNIVVTDAAGRRRRCRHYPACWPATG